MYVPKFTKKNQLSPRYEGQLIFMAEPIPYPKRPPCTPSRRSSFFAADVGQRPKGTTLRYADTFAHRFNAMKCFYRGPRTDNSQTSNAEHGRTETLICANEVRLAYFFPVQLLATNNGRAPYYQRASRGGCCLGGGPLLIVVGHRRSGVPLSSTRLRQ